MLPFLLVSTRPEDEAVEAEYRCFLRVTGLDETSLEQVRLDMLGLPDIDVNAYTGIIVAGSPYGTTTPDEKKTASQKRIEAELARLFTDIVEANTPCLTTGYGTEVATLLRGGLVSTTWAEEPQMVDIMLTQDGRTDPILEDFPKEFSTYVHHREAVESMPEGAVLLAKSLTCPVQAMRIGDHFYATQFNPEIDSDAIQIRLSAYEDAGYGSGGDYDSLVSVGRDGECAHQAGLLIRNFMRIAEVARGLR